MLAMPQGLRGRARQSSRRAPLAARKPAARGRWRLQVWAPCGDPAVAGSAAGVVPACVRPGPDSSECHRGLL